MLTPSELDTLTIEILWRRLVSVVEEAEAVLARTSFSSTVGEASDYSAAFMDEQGRLLAQSPSALGGFIGVLARATKKLLDYFPAATLQPGDVIISNDPWICAGHLPDVMALRPVFFRNRLIGYAANIAHLSDLGGRVSTEAADLFEEGLQIPPCMLYRAGELNEDVIRFIRANSRTPRQVVGDLQAQVTANIVIERRTAEALEEYGLSDVAALSEEVQRRTERAMRERIRSLPDGVYESEVWSDGIDHRLRIRVTIRITGDELTVDYDGTSDQVRAGINCPFSLTFAETVYSVVVALAPHLQAVEGSIAPIKVTAPVGSLLNPRFPAPVMIRVAVIHNAQAAIFRALSRLVPDHISPGSISAHYGGIWAFRFRGGYRGTDSPYHHGGPPQLDGDYVQMYLFNGGMGATGDRDGHPTTSMPANCANVPIEVMEARAPILFESKRLLADSGGAGRFCGGPGQRVDIRILSDHNIDFIPGACDRIKNPPFGLFGGAEGSQGGMWIDDTPVNPRTTHVVSHGQVVTVSIPGGGGFGYVSDRPPELVLSDLERGYISADHAEKVFGVSDIQVRPLSSTEDESSSGQEGVR